MKISNLKTYFTVEQEDYSMLAYLKWKLSISEVVKLHLDVIVYCQSILKIKKKSGSKETQLLIIKC